MELLNKPQQESLFVEFQEMSCGEEQHFTYPLFQCTQLSIGLIPERRLLADFLNTHLWVSYLHTNHAIHNVPKFEWGQKLRKARAEREELNEQIIWWQIEDKVVQKIRHWNDPEALAPYQALKTYRWKCYHSIGSDETRQNIARAALDVFRSNLTGRFDREKHLRLTDIINTHNFTVDEQIRRGEEFVEKHVYGYGKHDIFKLFPMT